MSKNTYHSFFTTTVVKMLLWTILAVTILVAINKADCHTTKNYYGTHDIYITNPTATEYFDSPAMCALNCLKHYGMKWFSIELK